MTKNPPGTYVCPDHPESTITLYVSSKVWCDCGMQMVFSKELTKADKKAIEKDRRRVIAEEAAIKAALEAGTDPDKIGPIEVPDVRDDELNDESTNDGEGTDGETR